jgi:hypothetical protein
MDNNVDWDKVNRGKVRYGFALELYKSGKELMPTELGRIEAFVDYVMGGVEEDQDESDNKKEVVKRIPIKDKVEETAKSNEKAYIREMISLDSEGLNEKDKKSVLDALESGKITMDNLQASLDKIFEMKKKYK